MDKSVIKELYLHWNLLKSVFTKNLFASLAENEKLVVLDLSNNSSGIGIDDCLQEINEFFSTNKTLVHLDLSFNYFGFEQSKSISLGLEKNKTIYGFHFVGNAGYVDNRGFLIPEEIT